METVGLRNLMESMISNGFPLNDLNDATELFNDNKSCGSFGRIKHDVKTNSTHVA